MVFGLLTGAFVVSRVTFLDRDLPPWGVAQLQPIDEFVYTISAFDFYRYGSAAHRVVSYLPTDAEPALGLLQSAMTAITLYLFGNNYYGLRLSSVVAGLGVFVIVYVLLRRHAPSPGASVRTSLSAGWPLLLMVYLVTDYGFDMAARVAEPTIFQMLAMVFVMLVVSTWPNSRPSMVRAFSIAAIAASAWLFVYVYNSFVLAAVLLMLVVESRTGGFRRIASHSLAALAGCVTAAVAYSLVVFIEYQQTLVQVYQMDIHGRGGSMLSGLTLNYGAIHLRAIDVSSTNIFRFDLPVLLAFELGFPVFLYRMFRERDTFALLVTALIAFLFLQFCIVPDSPQRKLVLLSPLVVVVIGMSVPYVAQFTAAVRSSHVAQIVVLLWLAVAGYWFVRMYFVVNFALDSAMKSLSLIGIAALIGALFGAVVARGRFSRTLALIGCAAAVVPGAYFSAKQLWMNPTYRYRDAMAASAPYLNGHVTAGGYSYSFRLYNSSVPVLDPNLYMYGNSQLYWQYMERLFREGTAHCLVTNADGSYEYLGLKQVAKFEIDVAETPVIGVYCRGSQDTASR